MRIHLVAPSRDEVLQSRAKGSIAPPLGLAILASLTPPEDEVSLVDENLSPVDLGQKADLVGITAVTQTASRAYELADGFRTRGTKVVLGGMHPTAVPQEAAQHADAVVVGEAEKVWPLLLEDHRAGQLQTIYSAQERPQLAGLPVPRRDLFDRRRYVFPDTVYTTRGCPFGCGFCSVTNFFGGSYRSRPAAEVAREVDQLEGRQVVFFVDDNIAAVPAQAKELFRSLVPLRLSWFGQATVTVARDEDLLAAAAASGCVGLFLGIESLSPEGLISVGKRHNHVSEYEQAIDRIHKHGITVFGAFIFGLDSDSEDVFELTVRFAQRMRLEGAQFTVLTPYPGTPLLRTMEMEGRILSKDWSRYRGDMAVFAPLKMSPGRLEEGTAWAWKEFYSLGSIWQRVGLSHPRLLPTWVLNLNFWESDIAGLLFDKLAPMGMRILSRSVTLKVKRQGGLADHRWRK